MMRNPDHTPVSFPELCRGVGIKNTPQRMEIYRELASTHEHPDAETIYRRVRKRIPAISFDTVYRTLRTFHEKKLIARLRTDGDRARFDANHRPHHHFICEACGAVQDFESPDLDTLTPPPPVYRLGTPTSVQVEVHGRCKACAARTGASEDLPLPAGG